MSISIGAEPWELAGAALWGATWWFGFASEQPRKPQAPALNLGSPILMRSADDAAHAAASAAQAALDRGLSDEEVVGVAVRAACNEFHPGVLRDSDAEIRYRLRQDGSELRGIILHAVDKALRAYNIGGSLPLPRADSLYGALQQFANEVE